MRSLPAISALALGVFATAPADAELRLGQPAPPFEGKSLGDGTPIRLADHAGKVVYLDFWASWCGPCQRSLPFMEQLHREFGEAGLVVIAVNVDEQPEDALRFLQRFAVGYAVLDDSRGALAALYDVQDMPSSYLIDRDGIVRTVHRGFNRSDARRLRQAVAKLVTRQP